MAYNYEYPYVDPARYNDDWMIKKVKELDEAWKNAFPQLSQKVDDLEEEVAYIKSEIQKIVGGDYAFLEEIIQNAIKNVWFGLTDSGYFVAYIPESWSDVQFATTGLDITVANVPEYGHLVVKY